MTENKKSRRIRRKTKIILIILAALIVIGAAAGGILLHLYKTQHPAVMALKDDVKILLCDVKIDKLQDKTAYLSSVTETEEVGDSEIMYTDDGIRLLNNPDGYFIDLPQASQFDFDLAPLYTKIHTPQFSLTVSREYSTEDDVSAYIDHYLYRFLLDEQYRAENRIELISDSNEGGVRIITVRLLDTPEELCDTYTYVTLQTGTKIFYNLMYKYSFADFDSVQEEIAHELSTFTYFRPYGDAEYNVEFSPELPETWSPETAAIYSDIENAENVYWGIFSSNTTKAGERKELPELEDELDYNFSVELTYIHFGHDFPAEFMQEKYDDGKIVELTYQVTDSNNELLFGYTPMLDIYRGECDGEIRRIARQAKEFGHPFLFRLNNEMNSDWTSYSGVVNLCDPELYISVWQRFYDIFEEEGVDNAIWIYNPNDKAFPPCKWNNFLAFYPGDEYCQMIGVTGYNTGTYYAVQNNEQWREFKNIYDVIEKEYDPFFGEFPWIITEFASSSVGGDKVAWINSMFEDIKDYGNIKIAVWFNYADYDPAYEGNSVISRPYWLDETEETTAAMSVGLNSAEPAEWSFS